MSSRTLTRKNVTIPPYNAIVQMYVKTNIWQRVNRLRIDNSLTSTTNRQRQSELTDTRQGCRIERPHNPCMTFFIFSLSPLPVGPIKNKVHYTPAMCSTTLAVCISHPDRSEASCQMSQRNCDIRSNCTTIKNKKWFDVYCAVCEVVSA